MCLYSLHCVPSPQRLRIIYLCLEQDGTIVITTLNFQNHWCPIYFLMYIFCEVSIALEKAIAVEVKSGMSQQRQRDPYISWTTLSFRTQTNLVKEILHYFLYVVLASVPKASASVYSSQNALSNRMLFPSCNLGIFHVR